MNDTAFAIPDVVASNLRHDQEHGDPYEFDSTRVRSGWNEAMLMRRGKLTERQIKKYELLGYYSMDFKLARKQLMEKKANRRRDGNFDLVAGRMIYRPS